MVKITEKKFKKVIINSRGNMTLIAERLNVARSSVYSYINKNEWAKKLIDNEAWKPFDIAESKLHTSALVKEEGWAIRTMLLDHKKGREMGYGREQNLNIGGQEKPVKLILEIIDKTEDVNNENNADEGIVLNESSQKE